jgi:hypothetical protein
MLQEYALPLLSKKRSVNRRQPISRKNLQSAITAAVKKFDPSCEAFVDIIVEHTKPNSRLDANWGIRGVKFGKANRDKSNEALRTIVEQMQREFSLSEDRHQ